VSTQLPFSEILSFDPLSCLSEELRTPPRRSKTEEIFGVERQRGTLSNILQRNPFTVTYRKMHVLVAPVAGYERVVDIAYT
jgi:hypothetical protein